MFITSDAEEWMTFVALYVLDNVYYDREAEFLLVAAKAKAQLSAAGINNPEKQLDALELELVQ